MLLAEDQLQVVYLHSCVLAEYLLTAEFTSLQTISRDLNLDPSDIPLLLVGQNIGVAVQSSVSCKYFLAWQNSRISENFETKFPNWPLKTFKH